MKSKRVQNLISSIKGVKVREEDDFGNVFVELDTPKNIKKFCKDEGYEYPFEVMVEERNHNRLHFDGIPEELRGKGYGRMIYEAVLSTLGIISTRANRSLDVSFVWDSLKKRHPFIHTTDDAIFVFDEYLYKDYLFESGPNALPCELDEIEETNIDFVRDWIKELQ